jgi:transposase
MRRALGGGQSYITLLTVLEQSRVIEVVDDRTAEAAAQLWQALTPEQKEAVEAVAVDMWEPFIRTIEKEVPDDDIVHDSFISANTWARRSKVARAWVAKELFSQFRNYQEEGWKRRFFKRWFGWVSRSQLKPVVEVAHMLKRHLENLLTYLKHHITNAVRNGRRTCGARWNCWH